MKKRRNLILSLIFVGVLIALALFSASNYIINYCNNYGRASSYLSTSGYAAELGLDRFTNEAFLKAYGEPASVQRWSDPKQSDRELVLHSYPSFDVLYLVDTLANGDTQLVFLQVVIRDDSIRFGRWKIGVGTQRSRVQIAYLLEPKLPPEEVEYESHDFPKVDGGFYGENWWRVLFSYDASGKVETMAYTISPN